MRHSGTVATALAAALALALAGCARGNAGEAVAAVPADIVEYAIDYPDRGKVQRNNCDPQKDEVVHPGSTHEIAFDHKRPGEMWITGQNYDRLVAVNPATAKMRFVEMEKGSGPHGIEYDSAGQLWVTLECKSRVVRVDGRGKILESHDVRLPDGNPSSARARDRRRRPFGLVHRQAQRDARPDRPDGKLTIFRLADPRARPSTSRPAPTAACGRRS